MKKKFRKIVNKYKPSELCLSIEEIMRIYDYRISFKYEYILENMFHLDTYIDKKVYKDRDSLRVQGLITSGDLIIGLEELERNTNMLIKYVDGYYLITFNIILSNQ